MIHQLLMSLLLMQAPSFIEQSISSAQEEITKEPNHPEGYNDLAMAMVRKIRETGDLSFAGKAEVAIAKSLKLEPANFGARRARVATRLAQHRYEDALEEAEALRKLRPDDNPVYAYLSEAEIARGNYDAAEKAVQRMLDLRSVNGPGFEAGATLRELIGYPEGAIDWWRSAINLVSDRDGEERAHIYSQMARIYRETGKYGPGVECAQKALELVPEYPEARFELARIRIEQKQPAAAITLLAKSKDLPSLYWGAFAQEQAGHTADYATFEKQARAVAGLPGNADALLIRYLADHKQAGPAVTLAETALGRHHDLFTRQAYAIALARAGKPDQALEQIRKALEPGLQDISLYLEAGKIARLKNAEAAAGYFKKAFELGSSSVYSTEILKRLSNIDAAGQSPL